MTKRGREASTETSKKIKTETKESETKEYRYLTGFGNELSSEALKDALPKFQNTPQKCPYNLRAELVSGTPFTAPRKENQRTWVYRILPSAKQGEFKEVKDLRDYGAVFGSFADRKAVPNQFRWKPFPMSEKPKTFIQGLNTLGGAGAAELKTGMAIHIYNCNQSMKDTAFCNSDGDFLIVPQEGELNIRTELGWLRVGPGFIAVIQRGWRWSVDVTGPSRGYVAEIFESHFRLPELGPIGSNGLANPRDFEHPVADYEECSSPFHIIQKFGGNFFAATLDHSPFDVVAWHGNYVPYRYDLSKFCPVNATLYDHLDPSIFTVLTAQTAVGGTAVCDFVIFPPRWAVQEHTFRPPYYHRNCMSEFMGNIRGRYEAKPTGFLPGGATLHSIFAPHGPDAESYGKAVESDTSKPVRLPDDSLAFMFESTYMLRLTEWALKDDLLDLEYVKHGWGPLKKEFSPSLTPSTSNGTSGTSGTSSSSSSTSSSSSSSK